ncbi:unnamed protein product [Dibothriocephalus latus]|uniref:SP-RING-type domain-containing protein n=1 Tax=Dibothriocephalus latus TaxID=60516 RepID=A0A3P7P7M0_DIBLA|nr:unnamed protein product [Dibothriocephalus latus]
MVKSKLSLDEDLQSDGWIPVSLLCPLALTRIKTPVRSVNCDHLQCFDLSSYLTINKKRPRWSCPVCSSPAPFRDLRRDDFFVKLMADGCMTNVEMVHVTANGYLPGASTLTKYGSAAPISTKELIPKMSSSANSTIAADPPLPNEISMMSPCILESYFLPRPGTPGECEIYPFNGCVLLLDDDDEDQEGNVTQLADVHSIAATTTEQSEKRTFVALNSAPRT